LGRHIALFADAGIGLWVSAGMAE